MEQRQDIASADSVRRNGDNGLRVRKAAVATVSTPPGC